jgi:hypothetical protein
VLLRLFLHVRTSCLYLRKYCNVQRFQGTMSIWQASLSFMGNEMIPVLWSREEGGTAAFICTTSLKRRLIKKLIGRTIGPRIRNTAC